MFEMNKTFVINTDENLCVLCLDANFFKKECILRVAAQLSDVWSITMKLKDDNVIELTVKPAKSNVVIDDHHLREIMNELRDHQLRVDLENKFGEIRKNIVEYAFSKV